MCSTNVRSPKLMSPSSSVASLASMSRSPSFNSSQQLLAQRKLFAESQIGRTSFHRLLEPKLPQHPTIAPYRVVLGNVKDKVLLQQCYKTGHLDPYILLLLLYFVQDYVVCFLELKSIIT